MWANRSQLTVDRKDYISLCVVANPYWIVWSSVDTICEVNHKAAAHKTAIVFVLDF